jgi:bacterial/archaeal transporter family-2 protein
MVAPFIILLAFFNGFLVIATRLINAKLGLFVSSAGASFWNHAVGFLFLLIVSPIYSGNNPLVIKGVPLYLFLGGVIGSAYVILNNFVIPKIGATTTTILVIGGQITIATAIDFLNHKIDHLTITIVGITLVVFGMWVGKRNLTIENSKQN